MSNVEWSGVIYEITLDVYYLLRRFRYRVIGISPRPTNKRDDGTGTGVVSGGKEGVPLR